MATVSSREFNQDVGAAKRRARLEPVFITDRGEPAHVLLSIEEYRRLAGEGADLLDRLCMEDHVDFEPGLLELDLRVPEL